MIAVQKYFSPQSASGSFVFSICVHVAVAASILFILRSTLSHHALEPAIAELGYEVFDEPPAPVKEVHKVMRSAEPVVHTEPKAIVDNSPKEMQDDKGVVSGTQTKAVEQSNIGSTSDGIAASTPYYKIKPKYPAAALQAGTEGWIQMNIDINEKGEVENVRVTGGENRNLFQSEARRAVEQWKYRPFVDSSGKAFKKIDHQVRVEFKLQDAG